MKKLIINILQRIINKLDNDYPYCNTCRSCGITECCGIENFLYKHVKGKTNCLYEQDIIENIIEKYEDTMGTDIK